MKILLLLLGVIISPVVFADSIFTPSSNDQSLVYLSYIFGNVEGVLQGSNVTLLKGVLVDFNNAVLALGGIVVTYSLIVGTLHTANEGQMLGKDWNSVWIPLRTAFGFALLVPVKVKSYALIQVAIMWVIVQGVGAGDYLWSQGLELMQQGVVPTSVPKYPTTPNTSGSYQAASQIFVAEVCAQETANIENGLIGNKYKTNYLVQGNRINFGITGITPVDICGSIALDSSGSPESAQNNMAVSQMVTEIDPLAQDFLNWHLLNIQQNKANAKIYNELVSIANSYATAIASLYYSGVQGGPNNSSQSSQYAQVYEHAKASGWIFAGAYYLTLSQISNSVVGQMVSGPHVQPFNSNELTAQLTSDDMQTLGTTLKNAMLLVNSSVSDINSPSDVSQFFTDNLSVVTSGFMAVLYTLEQSLTGGGTNPILAIQQFGYWMYIVIIALWAIFTVVLFTVSLILFGISNQMIVSFFGGGGLGPAFATALSSVMTPIMVAAGMLLGVGITMAYYTPLIPYLIFTLAAIGWMMLVIEAMVAAPILAIGILHPEGQHTVFGHGQAGIMLLAGAFLRPALMIVGYFAAMVMSYVVVSFVARGFTPMAGALLGTTATQTYNDIQTGTGAMGVVTGIAGAGVSAVGSVVGTITLVIIFAMLIFIVLNKAFSLIHVIPDKVMRWIGQQGEGSSVEQELGQIQGGAGKVGEGVGEAGSKTQSRGIAMQRAGRQEADRQKSAKDDEGGGPKATGGDAGGGGAGGGGG